ncbi:YciI family protein [Maritalea myrionectae]|uniref:YciI family protein n=1 Tax=Maritalea myrionectae TaxID=454601 RepID=UPI0003FF6FA7|nr:YciI family protein [Maritalea myrionectae]
MSFLTNDANLFVIELTYKVALDAVEPHLAAHRAFLDVHYQAGHFLASGAKVPRDGGIILATAASKADVHEMIAQDPFHQHDLAHYTITEFVPSKSADCLK